VVSTMRDRCVRTRTAALALAVACASVPFGACIFGSSSNTSQSPPASNQPISPVSAGDAFVSQDEQAQTWTIGNTLIEVTFGLTPVKDLVLQQMKNQQTGRALQMPADVDSLLTVNGQTLSVGATASGFTFQTSSDTHTDVGVQLDFTFDLPTSQLRVVRSYACYNGAPTLEVWTTVEATGTGAGVTVSNPNVWRLIVPAGTVHYVSGLQGLDPGAGRDNTFGLQSRTLNPNEQLSLGADGRSTEQAIPVVMTDAGSDEFFGGLLWSGSWGLSLERRSGTLLVTAGLPGVETTVDQNHPLETPHGFFGFTSGGMKDVSRALRGFVDNGLRPGRSLNPLVTYNTWFAYATRIDETSVMNEMARVASLGTELFVLDAGWWTGAGRVNDADYTSGLGNYAVDSARFPSGLQALSNQAHNLGMKFGIWVEPERTALENVAQPGLVQEAWLATNEGQYLPGTPNDQQTFAQICLADVDARNWVLGQLTTLIDQVQPDYLKWDNNFWINCTRAGHGHGASDGNLAHVKGLYSILSELHSRYPNLLIENCSGGGNRLDLGMLRYTDVAWMDDHTEPAVHVRHNLEGLGTIFPPAYLFSFLIDYDSEPLHNAPDLPLYLTSRMPGILGLTFRVDELDDADQEAMRRQIAVYKSIRDTVRNASAVLLTDQAAVDSGPSWDALEEVIPDSGEALVFAFRNDPGIASITLQPTGLLPDIDYEVATADGVPIRTATGADLMAGLVIDGSAGSASHVLILRPQASSQTAIQRAQSSAEGGPAVSPSQGTSRAAPQGRTTSRRRPATKGGNR
jgi:alpha-galactosidase